jgi:hypothetical protein
MCKLPPIVCSWTKSEYIYLEVLDLLYYLLFLASNHLTYTHRLQPMTFEGSLHVHSFMRVFYQQALHKGQTLTAILLPNLAAKNWIRAQDVLHHFRLVLPSKGRTLGHHHVHDDSRWPNITFFVIALQQHFRCYVVGSPYPLSQSFTWSSLYGYPEIYYLQQLGAFLK